MKTGKPHGKMERVKCLLEQGKTNRKIAKDVYSNQTELGQKRVRATASKLRKKGDWKSALVVIKKPDLWLMKGKKGINKKRGTESRASSQLSCGGVVASQPFAGFEVVRAPVGGFGSLMW